jgi:pilus assembly protein CpaF
VGLAESESAGPRGLLQTPKLLEAKVRLHHKLIDELNLSHIEKIPRSELRLQVQELISEYVSSERIPLNLRELGEFIDEVIDELTGLGPIEPILKDPTVTDILINTHDRVYVERNGHSSPRRCGSATRRTFCAL